jgi:heterotetrameric sarcosine oxidase gamma subunit
VVDRQSEPGFAMTELRGWSLIQLVFGLSRRREFAEGLRRLVGLSLPPRIGEVAARDGIHALRLAPDRIWILVEPEATTPPPEAMEQSLGGPWGSSLSLTQGRRRYRLSGRLCLAVLAKGIALDLQGSELPPGRAAQTQLHRVPVLLHRLERESIDLFVPRSFSDSIEDWIADAARETGWQPAPARQDRHPAVRESR